MTRLRTIALLGAATLALGACAARTRPATLVRATDIYNQLSASGANARVEGEMIKAREAINDADLAFSRRSNTEFLNGLAHIALRQAETARAEDERIKAQQAADSLRTARLNYLLSLSEARRQQLLSAQQLSQEEIAQLRARNLLVTQEAAESRQMAESERMRADSLRRVAEEANARLNQAIQQLRSLVTEITNLRETQRGLVISLSDILFDVNEATLKAGAQAKLDQIAAILKQYPDKQIAVEGHTDATGSDAYNESLSHRRAASVLQALVRGGVNPSLISSKGFGESQPVATNDTPAGRQQNRRVEIIVLGAGTVADVTSTSVRVDSIITSDTTRRDSTRTPR